MRTKADINLITKAGIYNWLGKYMYLFWVVLFTQTVIHAQEKSPHNIKITSYQNQIDILEKVDADFNKILEVKKKLAWAMAIYERKDYTYEVKLINELKAKKLCADLIASYNYRDIDIRAVIESEDITLDIETVVPIGLIINELITNSIKYAFEGRNSGVITISLSVQNEKLLLVIADDGVGLETEQLQSKKDSFGHSLIRAFRDKLDAEIDITGHPGTMVSLSIKSFKSIA